MSLLVADVGPAAGQVEPVLRERAALSFGASAEGIRAGDCKRAVEDACAMQAEARSVGTTEFLPVATAGLRNARNGREVAERIGVALEIPVRLLTGAEEAALVYRATRTRLGIGDERSVALDLGGGSLDLAVGRSARPDYVASEPLGVSRLWSELVNDDPMSDCDAAAIRERVNETLGPHVARLRSEETRCIAAGGTVRALARLAQAKRGRTGLGGLLGVRVARSELGALAVRLRNATREERLRLPTVRPRRVDLLPTGAIILMSLMEQLDLKELTISDWGLREGVLLE